MSDYQVNRLIVTLVDDVSEDGTPSCRAKFDFDPSPPEGYDFSENDQECVTVAYLIQDLLMALGGTDGSGLDEIEAPFKGMRKLQ